MNKLKSCEKNDRLISEAYSDKEPVHTRGRMLGAFIQQHKIPIFILTFRLGGNYTFPLEKFKKKYFLLSKRAGKPI